MTREPSQGTHAVTARPPLVHSASSGDVAPGEIQIPAVDRGLRIREQLKDLAPTLCLVGTLAAAGIVYYSSGDPAAHHTGFAQTTTQSVAAMETARVHRIQVSVGQRVSAGQIVATLDTATIDAEIAVAKAKRAQLEADLRAEKALLEQGLDEVVEELERERAIHREEQARASAEAKALEGEASRVQELVAQRQAVAGDLAKVGLQRATADAVTSAKPRTLGLLAKQLEAAKERRQQTKAETSALAAKISAGLAVADRTIELLEKRREGYVLRAAQAGSVSMIERRPGDVVDAGATIVRVVSTDSRVVVCVPERSALSLREGDPAKLTVRGRGGAPLHGHTVALGPIVTELPSRCWTSPRAPMWGREVTVGLDEPVELIAGQAFDVAFDPSPASGSTPSATPSSSSISPGIGLPNNGTSGCAATSGPEPKTTADALSMKVPADLAKRTRFEPSGVLALGGRYLVVSDDTGHEDDHEGEPWLFAMSASGEVSPDPVALAGVREINDLEAITAANDGSIYLLSSQSFSKKGKRKPARTALLRAKADGSGLRVDGEAHLAEWLDGDAAKASALGLPDGTRALDLEGLAWHDGALFVGVKAPLDADGNALVWKIGAPAALFEGGPAKADVALWGRVKVDVEVSGKAVPGGISDLLFFPDGTLAIASTPSTAEGAAGALWRVDKPQGGTLSPKLVQRFPSLKPEGLSPSLTAGKLMIVFDTGAEAPLFQEIAWAP